jgi:hypothetical protein
MNKYRLWQAGEKRFKWLIFPIILFLIGGTAYAADVLIRDLQVGVYVLEVMPDGTHKLTTATVLKPDGTTTPTPTPGGSVREVSSREYLKIGALGETHRVELSEKFQGLAFGLVTKRRLSGKPFIAVEDAAEAETAIIKSVVTEENYSSFEDWQGAYRVAINATKPMNAEELADQYDQVAMSLKATALDIEKLMKILQFIMKLIALFGGG